MGRAAEPAKVKGLEKVCSQPYMTFFLSYSFFFFSVLVYSGCALSITAVNSVPLNSTHDCIVSHCLQLLWQNNIFTSTMSTSMCVGSVYFGLLFLCEMSGFWCNSFLCAAVLMLWKKFPHCSICYARLNQTKRFREPWWIY